jgi:hypothetical protein
MDAFLNIFPRYLIFIDVMSRQYYIFTDNANEARLNMKF